MGETRELTGELDLRAVDIPVGGAATWRGAVPVDPLVLAGQRYTFTPAAPDVRLDVARTLRSGWHLRLRSACTVNGPCWVCLGDAHVPVEVDATEMHDGATDDPDMESAYVVEGVLDVTDWLRDAIAEALPARILCRDDCKGICPQCGADLNAGPCDCGPPDPDPRWGPLADLAERMRGSGTDTGA